MLHFISDDEDPWQIVATLRDALAPGSYLVLAHATDEARPRVAQAAEKVYNRSVTTNIHMRSHADVLRFFDGFDPVDPGLVYIPEWRPDSPDDVPGRPEQVLGSRRGGLPPMTGDLNWVPPGVDTKRANVARVYDYWLGGSHNFLADQDAARATAAVQPSVRMSARANRAFLGRAVRFLAANGIRQFLDIGSGIPTEGNVHEIAQRADPDARIVYADVDPVAVAHSRAILGGSQGAAVIEGDLREPAEILRNATVRGMIDFAQPAGLLLVAVLHFLADADDPWRIVATLRDALAPGSYLAICHGTSEGTPVALRAAEKVYNRSVATSVHVRPRAGILRFFDGFDLVEPGLVYIPEWRPDPPQDVPEDPSQVLGSRRRRPQALVTRSGRTPKPLPHAAGRVRFVHPAS